MHLPPSDCCTIGLMMMSRHSHTFLLKGKCVQVCKLSDRLFSNKYPCLSGIKCSGYAFSRCWPAFECECNEWSTSGICMSDSSMRRLFVDMVGESEVHEHAPARRRFERQWTSLLKYHIEAYAKQAAANNAPKPVLYFVTDNLNMSVHTSTFPNRCTYHSPCCRVETIDNALKLSV